jgi:DNA polymerase-3 subunit delta'
MTDAGTPIAGLPPIAGHDELRERLRRAVGRGRLPQSLRFHGPDGVGKQTLALWTAALLLCEKQEACGECRSCRLAAHLEHPDIHWHFPLSRPKQASTPTKFREKLEEARHAELAARREDPLAPRESEGVTGIYLAAVEEMRAQAARRPAMGATSVFIVGEAEQMVPQQSSPEAANAFLKLLEEPPPYAYLILTSSRPNALLPTIRSRALAVRLPPLPDREVETFLTRRKGLEPSEAERIARQAQGSIGHALRIADGLETEQREAATAILRAALAASDAERYRAALAFSSFGARGEFSVQLAELGGLLRDLLGAASGHPELATDPQLVARILSARPLPAQGLVAAMERVEEAQEAASGNANPQSVAAVLLFELNDCLQAR